MLLLLQLLPHAGGTNTSADKRPGCNKESAPQLPSRRKLAAGTHKFGPLRDLSCLTNVKSLYPNAILQQPTSSPSPTAAAAAAPAAAGAAAFAPASRFMPARPRQRSSSTSSSTNTALRAADYERYDDCFEEPAAVDEASGADMLARALLARNERKAQDSKRSRIRQQPKQELPAKKGGRLRQKTALGSISMLPGSAFCLSKPAAAGVLVNMKQEQRLGGFEMPQAAAALLQLAAGPEAGAAAAPKKRWLRMWQAEQKFEHHF